MSSMKRSGMLIGANLKDAVGNLETLMKELATSTEISEMLEQLRAERDEFQAEKLQLQAEKAEFKAKHTEWNAKCNTGRSASSDVVSGYAKAVFEMERVKLEDEKAKLRISQSQHGRDRSNAAMEEERVEDLKKQLVEQKKIAEKNEAQVESLFEILREQKKKHDDEKTEMHKKMEELKQQLSDKEMKGIENVNELSAKVSQHKTQVENLVLKLRGQEKQLDEKKVIQKEAEDLKKQLLIQETRMVDVMYPKVFFDISIKDTLAGRIEIALFAGSPTRTVENFRALCTGEKGFAENGKPLHYKGSAIRTGLYSHSLEGGDIKTKSIYGDYKIPTDFLKHTRLGDVGMTGYSAGTMFFIRLDKKADSVSGALVGRIVEGFDVLKAMVKGEGKGLLIADCGQVCED